MIEGIDFTRPARKDIRVAFEWYESQQSGLGERLLNEIRDALNHCASSPEAHPLAFGWFRKLRIGIFPYRVYYSLHGSRLVVHAVFHSSRNPQTLQNRLRKEAP